MNRTTVRLILATLLLWLPWIFLAYNAITDDIAWTIVWATVCINNAIEAKR